MDNKDMGVQTRVPATANLMIDSADRTTGNMDNFAITKNQSILNGFFNRIGTTELVLEWFTPNLFGIGANRTFTVNVGGTPYSVLLSTGFYTVAGALNAIVAKLNAIPVPAVTFSITQVAGTTYLTGTGNFFVVPTPLASRLEMDVSVTPDDTKEVGADADLRPVRYLDFVSDQLTYNQELKDASTTTNDKNVLARWYFAFDQPPALDQYGFPILMGYNAFCLRRTFSPPKQIKWDSRQPVGQLSFQVFTDQQVLLSANYGATFVNYPSNWLMTLQVSEN
jgi:hypothetical protein